MLKNYFVRLFIAMLMVITPLYFISCEVPVDEETIIEDSEDIEDNEDNESNEDNEDTDTDTEPEQDWFTLTIDEVTDYYHTAEHAHYPFNCIDFTFNGTNIVDFEWATDKFSDVANLSDDDLLLRLHNSEHHSKQLHIQRVNSEYGFRNSFYVKLSNTEYLVYGWAKNEAGEELFKKCKVKTDPLPPHDGVDEWYGNWRVTSSQVLTPNGNGKGVLSDKEESFEVFITRDYLADIMRDFYEDDIYRVRLFGLNKVGYQDSTYCIEGYIDPYDNKTLYIFTGYRWTWGLGDKIPYLNVYVCSYAYVNDDSSICYLLNAKNCYSYILKMDDNGNVKCELGMAKGTQNGEEVDITFVSVDFVGSDNDYVDLVPEYRAGEMKWEKIE